MNINHLMWLKCSEFIMMNHYYSGLNYAHFKIVNY